MGQSYQTNQTVEGPDITNYWQYFNLDRDPFAMGYDEALTYVSSNWEETLDLTQYLIHYKNELVALTGLSGAGKSLFAEILVTQLGDTSHIANMVAEQSFDLQKIIEFLSDSFMVPWKAGQSAEIVLDEQLESFQHKQKPCLLIVDNAHLLPDESIEGLLYMVGQQSINQMRFHVLFLGEPTLTTHLQEMLESDEAELVHFLTLEPFSEDETEQYIKTRLSASGWSDESLITKDVISRIYRLSEGNPARINRITKRFLLDTLTGQEIRADDTIASWKNYLIRGLGVLLIVLIIGVVCWIWLGSRSAENNSSTQSNATTVSVNGATVSHEVQGGETLSLPVPPDTNTATNMPAAVTPPSVPVAQPAAGSAVVAPEAATPAQTVPFKTAVPTQAVAVAAPAAAVTPVAPTAPTAPVTPAPQASVANAPAVASDEEVTSATPSSPPAAEAKVANKAVITTKEAIKHKPKKVEKPKSTAAKEGGGDYAIQLIGLSKSESLHKFIKDNHLEGKVITKTIKHQGKTITIVLYGHYQTLHEAEQAIATLPASLLNAGPWPRKIPE